MNRPDLVVDSATGVGVALPLAGPGVRAFAFLIDWHFRVVLAAAWYVVAALLYHRAWRLAVPVSPDAAWFVAVLAPPAILYFLYHPVLETAMRGRTPGKRLAGVQLVNRRGGAPGVGSLLARNAFRLIDALPIAYTVGVIATMATREHIRIGDFAAGTLLIYSDIAGASPAPLATTAADHGLTPAAAEVIRELLQRWDALDAQARSRLARSVLERSTVPTVPVASGERGAQAADTALRAELERLLAGTPL